jgi:ribosomal protein RSM22 (predicted rRNA methylase)
VKGKEDEKEEQDGVDEQWDTDFVEDKRSRRLKYSPLRYGKRESIAYIASRLNATYASTYRVLHEISVRCPSFHPETVLDFGSGVGTTVW